MDAGTAGATFLPVTDAIISTLLPVNAAPVRFAEPTDQVTCQPCSTAIILACSPDGRASASVPGSSSRAVTVSAGPASFVSAGPSSASPWAVSDRTNTSFHAASACVGQLVELLLPAHQYPVVAAQPADRVEPRPVDERGHGQRAMSARRRAPGSTPGCQSDRVELDRRVEAVRGGKCGARDLIGERLDALRDALRDAIRGKLRQRQRGSHEAAGSQPRTAGSDAGPRSPGRRPRSDRTSGSGTGPRPAADPPPPGPPP